MSWAPTLRDPRFLRRRQPARTCRDSRFRGTVARSNRRSSAIRSAMLVYPLVIGAALTLGSLGDVSGAKAQIELEATWGPVASSTYRLHESHPPVAKAL